MTFQRSSRRRFLRDLGIGAGAGLGAMSLPLLRGEPARATDGFPKRFVVWFTPNGSIRENWTPSGGETSFTLSRILEPLAPFQDRLVVVDGLDMRSTSEGPGDGHQKGMGHMLTGRPLLPGSTTTMCERCGGVSWASGISIDQEIANHIGDTTRFRSLELGVQVPSNANIWTRMCYRAASQPLPPDGDPYDVFERVFADLEPAPMGVDYRRARRQSVVDFVNEDFAQIRAELGGSDLARFEAHIEAVRDIERRLAAPETVAATCDAPMIGSRLDHEATANVPEIADLQMDLAAMAMACDLTRVVSFQWTKSVGQLSFPWLGISDQHHGLSHDGDGNAASIDKLTRINRWFASQLASLATKLDAIPEGDGTVLDNTCILWVNELGRGNSHTRQNVPIVMVGGAGGSIRTGRFLEVDRPHNDLLLTLAQAYGVGIDSFGDSRFCTGALGALL
jgi:hypothetical protein